MNQFTRAVRDRIQQDPEVDEPVARFGAHLAELVCPLHLRGLERERVSDIVKLDGLLIALAWRSTCCGMRHYEAA